MALSSHALTTLSTVKDELGITESAADSVLERMINASSEAIEQAAGGRHFEYEAGIIEYVKGFGTPILTLNRTPLLSLTSILDIDQAGNTVITYDSTTYAIESAGSGFVYREAGWPSTSLETGIARQQASGHERARLKVTYTGGWVTPEQERATANEADPDDRLVRTLPFDLEEACIMTVVSVWRKRGQDRQIASANVESGPVITYDEKDGILPKAAKKIVSRYRRVL